MDPELAVTAFFEHETEKTSAKMITNSDKSIVNEFRMSVPFFRVIRYSDHRPVAQNSFAKDIPYSCIFKFLLEFRIVKLWQDLSVLIHPQDKYN